MNKIKRYLLFDGVLYNESGGWGDFRGSYDTIEDAKAAFFDCSLSSLSWAFGHIIDTETGAEVWRFDKMKFADSVKKKEDDRSVYSV